MRQFKFKEDQKFINENIDNSYFSTLNTKILCAELDAYNMFTRVLYDKFDIGLNELIPNAKINNTDFNRWRYIIANMLYYINTDGFATGIAINSVSFLHRMKHFHHFLTLEDSEHFNFWNYLKFDIIISKKDFIKEDELSLISYSDTKLIIL